MRSAALLLGMLLLCVSPLVGRAAEVPATPDPADLPGIYECQGTGADGRPYRGAVIIEPDGGRFVVRWIHRVGTDRRRRRHPRGQHARGQFLRP